MMTRALNGATVKELREALGIKQTDLAERVGISAGHLCNLEKGIYKGSAPVNRKIADELGVPLASITYPLAAVAS